MLTGQCKKDFEKWFNKTYQNNDEKSLHIKNVVPTVRRFFLGMNDFYNFPFPMQYGVLVDFFDSVDLTVWVYKVNKESYFTGILKNSKYLINKNDKHKDLTEARKQAILKANEIYNNKT